MIIDRNEIQEMIRRFIKQKKITQKAFALMMGVSESCVSQWLSGKRNMSCYSYINLMRLFENKDSDTE